MSQIMEHLLSRRSVQAPYLETPGPDDQEIEQILTAASRVPDHKKLVPWRFLRFTPVSSRCLGEVLAERWLEIEPKANETRLKAERERFLRAPLVIGVVSCPNPAAPVPEWEQVLCAGAVCMNMLHAAHALGYAGQWLTEWYAFDAAIHTRLGLAKGERLAGFIHIGTPTTEPSDRDRPDLAKIVTVWEG